MNEKFLWNTLLQEAEAMCLHEPLLTKLIQQIINNSQNAWEALSKLLSKKLANTVVTATDLESLFADTFQHSTEIQEAVIADLEMYYERDYACKSYLEALLLFRGFQAVTAYRIARKLLQNQQLLTAKYLQNRIAEIYAMDIHPNAKLGKGIVVDHGMGLVIGETTEIGDRAFIFHNVTLGGTGHEGGDRHPKIKDNVFIGAGATILGNIIIHDHVNIAAGSVVTKEVPPQTTVAGIPAKVIGKAKSLQ